MTAQLTAADAGWHVSESLPDQIQQVEVVDVHAAQQSRWATAATGSGGGRLWCSEHPADVTPPVEVVDEGAESLSLEPGHDASVAAPTASLPLFLKEVDYAEEAGAAIEPTAEPPAATLPTLTNEEMFRIIREVAIVDSGDEMYRAISTDEDYRIAGHPAAGKRRFGMAFGLILFTQESGRLGRVLQLMSDRDNTAFQEVFGEHAKELLAVTNAATAEQRLQPVGGQDLSSGYWVDRLRRAAEIPACQYAQNEEAIEGLFRPLLNTAVALGLATDRGLAMVFDRVVTQGLSGGLRWTVAATCPLRSTTQRNHALQTLGYGDLSQFQSAAGIATTGVFDALTLAALTAAVRRQGLISLPTARQSIVELVATAQGSARRRLLRLRNSTNLNDVAYQIPAVSDST